jgi:hypothetical protein
MAAHSTGAKETEALKTGATVAFDVPRTPGSARTPSGGSRKKAASPGLASIRARFTPPPSREFGLGRTLQEQRRVDEMVKAIHSTGAADSGVRLRRAYKELSRGLDLPEDEVLSKPHDGDAARSSRSARYAFAPKEVPVRGPVPGGDYSPSPEVLLWQRSGESDRANQVPDSSNCSTISPPWGPDRANEDYPPWEQILKRQQNYRHMMEEQISDSVSVRKYRAEQESDVNRKTKTSLDTAHHSWGMEYPKSDLERATFRELLATVDNRKRAVQTRISLERQDELRCVDEKEREMVTQWYAKQAEAKQEKAHWASMWKAAAHERKKLEEAAKADALRKEKDFIKRTVQGMVPSRRIRRSKQECIAALENLPRKVHHAWATIHVQN